MKFSNGLFLVYSLFLVSRTPAHGGIFGLLALFGDTVFFLIFTALTGGQELWLPSIFYLFLLAEALLLYSPREMLVVVGVCIAFGALAQKSFLPSLEKTTIIAGSVACAFAFHKKRAENRLRELTQELAATREAVDKAREAERQRIAADFHDGPLQSIISFQMRLEILKKLLERDRNAGLEELEQLQKISQAQVREIRSYVRSMRPLDVPGANLAAEVRRIAEDFQKESGISVTFVGGDRPFSASPEICADVLQMVREALHNVLKHAGATRVAVTIEKSDKFLEISIDDNGHGFHFSGAYTLDELELLRLGPVSLKQRARSLNAELIVDSRPGRGAGLKLRVPI
jgi:signal transduction histidine kinase